MRFRLHFLTLLTCLFPFAARAGLPAEVEIFDRSDGGVLAVHVHRGERYVVGEPGHEYEIRVRNRTGGRLLAVTSVDGVNVVSGRTAATDQGGYVINPRASVTIDGWRKSLDEVAAFYFTAVADSYAARTGRPDEVGVIGVALFREKERQLPVPMLEPAPGTAGDAKAQERADGAAARSAAPGAERLGTGHGARLDSRAAYTSFERASTRPAAVIRIYYDSYPRLAAQGVVPAPRYARRLPDPFPGGFVPDP
jgi:hypothetical protein